MQPLVAPMQAAGFVAAHYVGLAFGLVFVATVFMVSESRTVVVAILVALALIAAAKILQLRQPSVIDVYFDAIAWMISGITLGFVVARAVFSFGAVNYHRVIGAVLLYLDIGVVFVALFCFVALLVPNAFNGLGPLQDRKLIDDHLRH